MKGTWLLECWWPVSPALESRRVLVERISVMELCRIFCLKSDDRDGGWHHCIQHMHAYTWVSLSISRMAASRILALVTDRWRHMLL